jgi:hypothetical protein
MTALLLDLGKKDELLMKVFVSQPVADKSDGRFRRMARLCARRLFL